MATLSEALDVANRDVETVLYDTCPHTGEKRGECICFYCTLAYGRIMTAIITLPCQKQSARRLTDAMMEKFAADVNADMEESR